MSIYTKMVVVNWNYPIGYVYSQSDSDALQAELESQMVQGKTNGIQYSKLSTVSITLWADNGSANAWILFLQSLEVGAYLDSSSVNDYVEPTYTKKTVTTYSKIPSSFPTNNAIATELNSLILAGKTDGKDYSGARANSVGTRIWTDATAAAAFIAFVDTQPIAAYKTGSTVENNDIVPITLDFSEFDPASLSGGQAVQDSTGTFNSGANTVTINAGVANGSGIAMTNLTPSNKAAFDVNHLSSGRLYEARWTNGSTYPTTRVALYYQWGGILTFWVLDPNTLSPVTAVNSGTFKFPVTLVPMAGMTSFTN